MWNLSCGWIHVRSHVRGLPRRFIDRIQDICCDLKFVVISISFDLNKDCDYLIKWKLSALWRLYFQNQIQNAFSAFGYHFRRVCFNPNKEETPLFRAAPKMAGI